LRDVAHVITAADRSSDQVRAFGQLGLQYAPTAGGTAIRAAIFCKLEGVVVLFRVESKTQLVPISGDVDRGSSHALDICRLDKIRAEINRAAHTELHVRDELPGTHFAPHFVPAGFG